MSTRYARPLVAAPAAVLAAVVGVTTTESVQFGLPREVRRQAGA